MTKTAELKGEGGVEAVFRGLQRATGAPRPPAITTSPDDTAA
jgi:hypothetical protein